MRLENQVRAKDEEPIDLPLHGPESDFRECFIDSKLSVDTHHQLACRNRLAEKRESIALHNLSREDVIG